MLVNLFFGLHNLGKFAAVDEPLWLFQRIPLFWQNVENMNWKSAKVSDKPGLTVAAVSGIGLLSENNPQQHKKEYTGTGKTEKNIEGAEKLNLIFRTPLFLFVLLLLPLFYFILKNYVGKSAALLAFVFLGLSPIIIGNSQIVNPDGILWTLSSLSLLAYLSYLSSNKRALLLASAIFLGFALLTKYTANILYIFFLFLIFAEYILNYQNYAGESAGNYLKERLKKYALLVIISFGVIFVFYPVVWAVPKKLFSLTIQSQPFAPVWPFFGTLLLFIFFDTFVLKSFVISPLLKIIAKTRRLIVYLILTAFLAIVFAVFFNVYNGMKPYDFMQLLASPKTSFRGTSLMEMFSTNFYSLIFGIHPLAILSLLTFLAVSAFRKKIEDKKFIAVIFLILFISVYYSGSVFSKVASTIRYQISLYPPILIAAGIALSGLLTLMSAKLDELQKRLRLKLSNAGRYLAVSVILLVILSSVLYLTEPFEMGYASSLLPKKYFLDVKDMGEGSYEASEFLNSLDNAKNITVWTDKKGVCTFFVGLCYTGFDKKLAQIPYNYFVVSSGRDSRTSNLTAYWKYFNIDFNALYAIKDTVYKLEINGRPGSYVKIIDAKIAPPFIWLPK